MRYTKTAKPRLGLHLHGMRSPMCQKQCLVQKRFLARIALELFIRCPIHTAMCRIQHGRSFGGSLDANVRHRWSGHQFATLVGCDFGAVKLEMRSQGFVEGKGFIAVATFVGLDDGIRCRQAVGHRWVITLVRLKGGQLQELLGADIASE